jgi:hypothetical protein
LIDAVNTTIARRRRFSPMLASKLAVVDPLILTNRQPKLVWEEISSQAFLLR